MTVGSTPVQTANLSGTGIDFSFAAGSGGTTATLTSGKSAVFGMLLTPAVPSSLPVTYTCTGAPGFSKCTVTSTYADLSGTSVVTATVLTGTAASMDRQGISPFQYIIPMLATVLPCGMMCLFRRADRRMLLSAILLVMTGSLLGCGSGRHAADTGTGTGGTSGSSTITPAGSYNIVVAATSAGVTKQVPVTLVVQAQ